MNEGKMKKGEREDIEIVDMEEKWVVREEEMNQR